MFDDKAVISVKPAYLNYLVSEFRAYRYIGRIQGQSVLLRNAKDHEQHLNQVWTHPEANKCRKAHPTECIDAYRQQYNQAL